MSSRLTTNAMLLSATLILGIAAPDAAAAVATQVAPGGDISSSGASPDAPPAVNRRALVTAIAAHREAFVPAGRFRTDMPSSQIPGPISGPGQVGDSNGNWRAPTFDSITRPPAARGRYDSIETAFDGDWSHAGGEEYRITGADTLGRPTTGYLFTPEATPHYLVLYNGSGWNQSTAGNQGRTAAAGYRVQGHQYGQGDLIDFSASCFVTGRRAGATNFLANPACGLFAGDAFAGGDGVYLNPVEINLDDQGHAAAGIGAVFNLRRSNAADGLGVWWAGVRLQQLGRAPVDVAWSASGKFRVGLDFTNVSFAPGEAAITLAAGQRIYGDARSNDPQRRFPTTLGRDWIERGAAGWEIAVDGASRLSVAAASVSTPASLHAASVSSTVGVASATLGGADVVGTGASASCTPGHDCDQFSGTYLVATGVGIRARGRVLTLTFAEARNSSPNCVVALQQDGELPLAMPVASTQTPRNLSVVNAAPLEPRRRYTISYVCGGS